MAIKNTPENFWSKVYISSPEACWDWQGAKTSSGYGSLLWHGQSVQAHRVAFFLSFGGIALVPGFRRKGAARRYKRFVLHACDNRACCNPAHLFLGSMRTNLLDAYAKGRKVQPRSQHANAKLSAQQVRTIRRQYDSGQRTQQQLAAKFKVSQRVISLVVRRESYKDI